MKQGRRGLIALAIVGALLAPTIGQPASAGKAKKVKRVKVKTTITLDPITDAGGRDNVTGEVAAARARCVGDRKVLFKRADGGKLGTVQTDDDGEFTASLPLEDGDLVVATVKKKVVNKRVVKKSSTKKFICKSARSKRQRASSKPAFSLTLDHPNGSVSCNTTVCESQYASGTEVTLVASPNSGYGFSGWSGDCSGTSPTCVLTMDANKAVTASFVAAGPEDAFLNVNKNGLGSGRVTSDPSGLDCDFAPGEECGHNFGDGATVTLTALADEGSTFSGWSGGGCSGTGTCVVTLSETYTMVSALFEEVAETKTITLNFFGSGSGRVTSSPEGLDCTTSCEADFAPGTEVTLTATPDEGNFFAGWVDPCSGTGTCVLTLNDSRSVGAEFTLDP